MCFNEEVSLATYIVGVSGSAALFAIDKKPEALFYGTVIQMQLIEYLLWKNQDNSNETSCSTTNKNISKTGLIINHLEPVALFAGISLFSKRKLPISVIVITYLYIIMTMIYTLYILENYKESPRACTVETVESSPHLHWKWNGEIYHTQFYTMFLIIIVMLSYFGLENGEINATLATAGFITSIAIYGKKHSAGSMWCLMAAFAPWILVGIYTL